VTSGTIKAVIFDYGGVLSTTPFAGLAEFEQAMGYPDGSLAGLLFGARRPGELDATTNGDGNGTGNSDGAAHDWHLLETGRLGLGEFHQRLVRRSADVLGVELDLDRYGRFLATLFLGIHWTMVHRVRELREEGYRTAILTNNIREWGPVWRATIPIELFDVVVDSCEVGLRKPDPAIFLLTCERLGVAPEAAVFLDDTPRHVIAAREVGMRGIMVGDPAEALAELDSILAEARSPAG
jgi:putative hydrolase of the HAD superfamily